MFIFDYRNSELCAESVPLSKIADDVGTPFYCYSQERLRQNYAAFMAPFAGMNVLVHYSCKANANMAVIRTLSACGAGAEVASAGELERALHAGVRPDRIVFNGAGLSQADILAAVMAGIYQINVDSIPELQAVNDIAVSLDRQACVALRLNPELDSRASKKAENGIQEGKFGLDFTRLAEAIVLAAAMPGIRLVGLAVHVGGHLYDYQPFLHAYRTLADMVEICRAQGFVVERLDLGGGIGVPSDTQNVAPLADYAAIVKETMGPLGCAISLEPGRRLVADAGILVTRILYVKETPIKTYLIVDAGMNDFIRPALYNARHGVLPVKENDGVELVPAAIVGPLCETKDFFGDNYFLSPARSGDLLAFLLAGAYGASMSSPYGGRAMIPEVMVSGSSYALVRRRVSAAEQMAWELTPSWMDKASAA